MVSQHTEMPAVLGKWSQVLDERVQGRLGTIEPESLKLALIEANSGGKRVRPLLSLWFGSCLGVEMERLLPVACLTEWLHSAFLIHDDIQDGDIWRRDRPTLWKSHGIPTALNAADWLLSAVYREISSISLDPSSRIRILEAVSDVHRRTVVGQQFDLSGRADPSFSLQRYEELVRSKTGRYLALGMVCVAIVKGLDDGVVDTLWNVGDQLGPAFQIQDDLLDLTKGKGRGGEMGNDIREGKPSILFAHSLQSSAMTDADKSRLVSIMDRSREETSTTDIQECIEIFDKCGSIEFAKAEARSRSAQGLGIFSDIDELSPVIKAEFESICEYLTERNR
ncbi:MAG: polyprenyl synthetase family protein [Planctomycetia bacterium]|nr:polyprenyl synthetase family protein [Planctomycetia bacterium]MBL6914809.1 polyprenyl synthetase family protein [Planctomycetota bacterium]